MKTTKTNRQGAIIVLFAILLPILLVILGFAVDYAYMQKMRNEVRVIADLGAKAAADELARTGGDVDAAIAAAQFIASNNSVAGSTLTLNPDQIIFGRASEQSDGSYQITDGQMPFNSVTVLAERAEGSVEGPGRLFFGQLYGSPTFDVRQNASSSFRDVEVILVLDRSGSMKYNVIGGTTSEEKLRRSCLAPLKTSRWIGLDAAVTVFLGELEGTQVQERIGLATFASNSSKTCSGNDISVTESSLDSPLSKNLDLVRDEMNRLNDSVWFGGTNIRAGIGEARRHFASNGTENVEKVIICLTDGVHNVGDGPIGEAKLCNEAGITIHTITFSEEANKQGMIDVANETSGKHFHAPDKETLEDVFRRLAGSFTILTK